LGQVLFDARALAVGQRQIHLRVGRTGLRRLLQFGEGGAAQECGCASQGQSPQETEAPEREASYHQTRPHVAGLRPVKQLSGRRFIVRFLIGRLLFGEWQ